LQRPGLRSVSRRKYSGSCKRRQDGKSFYQQFIEEASKSYVDALIHDQPLRDMLESGALDPLRDFSEMYRKELSTLIPVM
jgi:hypothetical protein